MPLYQYKCESCGEVNDKLIRISDRKDSMVSECKFCQQESNMTFQIGAPGISYMGVNHGGKIAGDLKNRFDQMRKHYPAMRSQY